MTVAFFVDVFKAVVPCKGLPRATLSQTIPHRRSDQRGLGPLGQFLP